MKLYPFFRFGFLVLLLSSCAAYRGRHTRFHHLFLASKLTEAGSFFTEKQLTKPSKNKLLYCLEKGLVTHLLGRYEESNHCLEQAHLTHANLLTKPIDEALVFLVNPTVTDYGGEDHEVMLLHYYKALNFLQLNQFDAALVECKRINIKLNQLGDRNLSTGPYRRDAFLHAFMGMVYQANGDYNNAFVAYRNAVEVYQEVYKPLFGIETPLQLKKDLIYVAHKVGFLEQVARYQQLFALAYDPAQQPAGGEVVFLWNNGLGPVKREWSIDFILVVDSGGVVSFCNEELGLFFPFPLPAEREKKSALSDIKLLRVAFPIYEERPLLYEQASVATDRGHWQPLELLEDVNAVAFQVLKQRMMSELGKSLLRLALKKAAEYKLRQQSELLGTILGGVNYFTECADVRGWETLPHSICYTRVHLPEGAHQLHFNVLSQQFPQTNRGKTFHHKVFPGKTIFQIVNSPHEELY